MMKRALSVLAAGVTGGVAAVALAFTPVLAADKPLAPEHHHWHHAGPFGTFDQAQLQRGFQVYRENCSSCHGMKFISFRNLAERGGPFYDPDYANPLDNPVVKALAAEYTIMDGPDDLGDMFDRPGQVADYLPSPFANEAAARAANGGAYPPDMSVLTKARHHGPDYIRSLLLGYREPPADKEVRPGLYYNPWFSGNLIAMAPPLMEGMIEYAPGQPEASVEQMAEDVTAFLTWAAEPHQTARKQMGFQVVIYLVILSALLWFSYKQIWRNVDH